MDKGKISFVSKKPFISRKHFAFLFGVTVACLLTVVSILQPGPTGFAEQYRTAHPINLTESVRVLCWVMTTPANHRSKAIHVKRTWGRRCNKLLLMSSVRDMMVGTIGLPVSEGRQSLWNKTREAFRYVYEHHLNEYDWFMKADDDTYVIMENLRYFLYPFSAEFPIYFGSKFRYPEFVTQGYFSGGAGYVLSREALKRFIEQALHDPDHCSSALDTEDLEMGRCMESVNVTAGDSRDLMGRKRFLPMEPVFHLTTNPADDPNFWYKYYSFYEPYYGKNCCSDLAISFHYVQGLQMYVMDYLIYLLHPYGLDTRNPVLPAKKSWEEAMIVPGPYPAGTTTVRTTTSTASSTTKLGTSPSEESSSVFPEGVSQLSEMLAAFSSTSEMPDLNQPVEPLSIGTSGDTTKIDDLIDRLLSDKRFTDKILEKLKLNQ